MGGAKELGIVYINIIRGAKEPRNLQNHRGARDHTDQIIQNWCFFTGFKGDRKYSMFLKLDPKRYMEVAKSSEYSSAAEAREYVEWFQWRVVLEIMPSANR